MERPDNLKQASKLHEPNYCHCDHRFSQTADYDEQRDFNDRKKQATELHELDYCHCDHGLYTFTQPKPNEEHPKEGQVQHLFAVENDPIDFSSDDEPQPYLVAVIPQPVQIQTEEAEDLSDAFWKLALSMNASLLDDDNDVKNGAMTMESCDLDDNSLVTRVKDIALHVRIATAPHLQDTDLPNLYCCVLLVIEGQTVEDLLANPPFGPRCRRLEAFQENTRQGVIQRLKDVDNWKTFRDIFRVKLKELISDPARLVRLLGPAYAMESEFVPWS